MRTRKPIKLPDSFYALFDYLRSRGYAEGSVLEYENHARRIAKFMQDNGYEEYTPEAYAAVMKHIDNGCGYENLTEYQKRCIDYRRQVVRDVAKEMLILAFKKR